MPLSDDTLWNLTGVSLRGRRGMMRLQSVTLQVRAGVTAVLGYSGAGKTSLLNLLAGFEKPDGGSIDTRCQPFWAPQNGGLWPHLTVREHLETVCPTVATAAAKPAWMRVLESFDLTHKLASRPDELSEGEQARLSVARALMAPADVLVMDEPLVHVDPARAALCWQAIRERLAETGASLVFSTHSPEAALGEADRAVCLREGALLYAGEVETLYRRAPTVELAGYLGPVNWLEPDEIARWLPLAPSCCRPEQLGIVPAADGAFVVERTCFRGSAAEADLREISTGKARRFYHRPAGDHLRPGERVTLRFLT